MHAVAGFGFVAALPRADIPEYWVGQFFILLTLSLAASISAASVRSPRLSKLLLALQLLFLVLLTIPEGKSIAVKVALSSLLVLECVLLNRWPQDLILSGMALALLAAFQRLPVAWVVSIGLPSLPDFLTFLAILILVAALALALKNVLRRMGEEKELTTRLRDTVTRLTDANVGFQRYASEVKSESVANERKRVSREMHDTIGYTITTLIMLMEAASDLAESDPGQLKRLLKKGIDQAIYSLDEIRKSLRELRAMENPQAHGLRDIKEMVKAFEDATHIRVSLDFSNVVWNFDGDVDEALYRMIQESLANAFRHGKATQIGIAFWQADHTLSVTIRDNGVGSAEINEGIGLAGMRERIDRVHGKLTAGNVADGFMLSATVPIREGSMLNDE